MPGAKTSLPEEPGETAHNYAEVFADGVGTPVYTKKLHTRVWKDVMTSILYTSPD